MGDQTIYVRESRVKGLESAIEDLQDEVSRLEDEVKQLSKGLMDADVALAQAWKMLDEAERRKLAENEYVEELFWDEIGR